MIKLKIKTGDTVRVIAGDHKGSEGKVVSVDREKNKKNVTMVETNGLEQKEHLLSATQDLTQMELGQGAILAAKQHLT